MDLDQLQSVRDRERQTDKLQQLRDSFYEEATAFVRDLRAERDRAAEQADDPFDAPEVNRLTDQIRTAEQTIEAIYEKRVGKLVKAATFAAADLPAEADGMTAEEEDLFETLVAEIQANRQRVLDRLTGTGDAGDPSGGPDLPGGNAATAPDSPTTGDASADLDAGPSDESRPPPPDQPPPEPADSVEDDDSTEDGQAAAGMSAADVMPGGDGPPEGSEAGDEVSEDGGQAVAADRELVRITDDVGAIFGVDEREYELAADDVVSLPVENAEPLLERDAAERL